MQTSEVHTGVLTVTHHNYWVIVALQSKNVMAHTMVLAGSGNIEKI